MSYQYIETLSDEAMKRYQSAAFVFTFAKTRSIKWMRCQLTERVNIHFIIPLNYSVLLVHQLHTLHTCTTFHCLHLGKASVDPFQLQILEVFQNYILSTLMDGIM